MASASSSLSPTDHALFLDAAVDIGHMLCRDALWWETHCNWTTDDIASVSDRDTLVHCTCDGDLYSGTAGIGLFLAQLASRTGDRVIARVARGALAHALAWQQRQRPSRPSLFSGGAGVGLACMLAGDWLDDGALREQGTALIDRCVASAVASLRGADIMHGLSGTLLAGLAAQRGHSDAARIDWLVPLGERLIATAQRVGDAWSWPEEQETVGMNGFSHGAAGIAVALAELAVASGRDDFREAAEHAIRHEQSRFDSVQSNWPDLFQDELAGEDQVPSFSWSWCHGAPGIGLGRLRLWRLLHEAGYREQAQAALLGTRRDVLGSLAQGDGNYSLCHGLAGNADLLIEAGLHLDDADALELARHVGREGIERYGRCTATWPCGVDGKQGISPGLMLGWAGTGWFLLRLDDPVRTPSVLTVDFCRPDFADRAWPPRR